MYARHRAEGDTAHVRARRSPVDDRAPHRVQAPEFDRDRLVDITTDWPAECKEILQRACPFIAVPSPSREALPAV